MRHLRAIVERKRTFVADAEGVKDRKSVVAFRYSGEVVRVQMGDTGGVRNSLGSRLPSYRQYETEDGMSRYEAPVFVPQAPSVVDRRRHSLSGMQLTDSLKQRTLQPVATFSTVSKSSRINSAREEFMELRQEVNDFQEYESSYEKVRSGVMSNQEGHTQRSVFGSQEAIQEAHARVSERRRRMSLGSQMELIQSQIESQPQPRPKSFMTNTTNPRIDSFVLRTAPSSRSNSVPKGRPSENPHPAGTARALHFDRVSESLPNFKPSEVKPDFRKDNEEILSFTRSPTDLNCRSNLRPVSKSESHTPIPQSPRGKQTTPTKYVSARAVAERLAKAIRGGSKSSKNKVDTKLAMPYPDNQDASGTFSDDSSGGRCVDQWPEAYSRQFNPEQALDHSGIYAEFNEKSQISSFRDRRINDTNSREEREIDMLKSWLDGMKQQGDGVYDDLQKKAKATCERLEMLDDEQSMLDDRILALNDFQSSNTLHTSDTIAALQQRLRRMHEEKKLLALEAASELRRRISERSAARKVFTLMKREMDAYAKVMEKEKTELRTKLEEEVSRRESTWAVKLDRIRSEELQLRERVMNLQEENSYTQKEISVLSSRDANTKARIKELESEVDSYRTRAEQAEADLDALHHAYAAKEVETRNLRNIVERLPELCGDYEKRMSTLQEVSTGNRKPSTLQRELSRLSSLEVALRSEIEVLKGSAPGYGYLEDEGGDGGYGRRDVEELHGELDRLQSRAGELQDDNRVLSVKLRLAVREKEEMRRALREAEEEIQELQRRGHGQEQHGQESSEMSQGDAHELEGDADSQGLKHSVGRYGGAEATEQLHAREMQRQSMRQEIGKQEDIIRGLEHSFTVASNTVEAQKIRIMRLTTRNEELVRLYHSKENEVQDLRVLSSSEAEGRRICEQDLSQVREQAFKCKQDLRAQDLNCKILKEKLSTKEVELEQRNDEVTALEHRRDWLEAEVHKLQRLLGEANQRATALDQQCDQQKEKIKNLQGDVEGHVKELIKLKDVLPRVSKERDDLSHEAEQMGWEALKLSAEVEVLRRKVLELDEDVMVRDGQITILCNTLEDRE